MPYERIEYIKTYRSKFWGFTVDWTDKDKTTLVYRVSGALETWGGGNGIRFKFKWYKSRRNKNLLYRLRRKICTGAEINPHRGKVSGEIITDGNNMRVYMDVHDSVSQEKYDSLETLVWSTMGFKEKPE